ncbi:MAG TPA: hypothetical protein VGX96_10040 [Candidatus Elarobacter sp.]|jgi:hypothetical protein|nr:hypothetical protein [Candidatus Elarobacter sp.]
MKAILVAAAAAVTVGLVGISAQAAMAPMQFRLADQNNSGEHGTATVLQGVNGVIVKLRLSGYTDGVDQPAHIHKGTCAKLDPKPTYGLTMVKDGQSQTTVPNTTLADLQKGDYAINVHKSAKEAAIYVACGNIPKK